MANIGPEPRGPASGQHETRDSDRVALSADVVIRRPGQPKYRVRVYDLSRHGCRLEFVERLVLDEQVWVQFGGLEALEARVRWARGYVVGLRFAKNIHPAVFDLLLGRLGPA